MVFSITPPSPTWVLSSSPVGQRSTSLPIKRPVSRSSSVNKVTPVVGFSIDTTQGSDALSRQRNASLPPRSRTTSSSATSVSFANTTTVTVGFELDTESFGEAQLQQQRPKAQGLLSQALVSDNSHHVAAAVSSASFSSSGQQLQLSESTLNLKDFSSFADVDFTLLEAAQIEHEVFQTDLVQTAYITAARAHRGQSRKDGSSVLQHCMQTSMILADLGCPAEVVASGLLHDVLRHSPMTIYQLEEFMPGSVVQLVQKVSELSDWSQKYRDNQHLLLQPSSIVDMITDTSDVEAVLIKLAHRLQDLRTIDALPRCKQVRMASESLEVFSVLANRLGSWYLKSQIEDLSFKILQPEEYAEVQAYVQQLQQSRALENSLDKLREQLHQAGISYADISGRIKNLYSIHKKTVKSGAAFADVYDVMALRVVVHNKHDCYRAMRAVQECWSGVPLRFKDYIRQPKSNGYQSLHETFATESGMPFEVQVRTHKMHYIAEYGLAAHWSYKEAKKGMSRREKQLAQVVQWKKFAVAKLANMTDKKVRPAGAPQQDLALASLGLNSCSLDSLDDPASMHELDPFLQLERFRLRPLRTTSSGEKFIMLHEGGVMDLKSIPQEFTVGDLLKAGLLAQQPPLNRLTINGVAVRDPHQKLRNSDIVEVLPDMRPVAVPVVVAPVAPSAPAAADPFDLDVYHVGGSRVPLRLSGQPGMYPAYQELMAN